jgi:hypothetical protein
MSYRLVDMLEVPAGPTVAIDCEWDPETGRLALVQVDDGEVCQILRTSIEGRCVTSFCELFEPKAYDPTDRHCGCPVAGGLCSVLQKIFKEKTVLGFNFHSDLKVLADYCNEFLIPEKLIDIKTLFRLANPKKKASLKEVCAFYGLEISKELQESDWNATTLSEEQLLYASKDTRILFDLLEHLKHVLEWKYTTLENKAGVSCAYISYCGIPVKDPTPLIPEYEAKVEAIAVPEGLNPSSPKQVRQYFLKTYGMKLESTAVEFLTQQVVLVKSAQAKKDLSSILDVRRALKAIQFVKQMVAHRQADGRIHPTFHPLVPSASGRTSCVKPNIQNPPRSSLRELFYNPHGFLYFDLPNIHARIAAELSEDARLVEAFNNGLDLHSITGARIAYLFGLDPKYKEYSNFIADKEKWEVLQVRAVAKSVFYGNLNGQGADGLLFTLARGGTHSGAKVSIERPQAQAIVDEIRKLYSGLTQFTNWVGRQDVIQYLDGFKIDVRDLKRNDKIAYTWLHYEAVIMKFILNAVVRQYANRAEVNLYMHDSAMMSCKPELEEEVIAFLHKQYNTIMGWLFKSVVVPPLELKKLETMPL